MNGFKKNGAYNAKNKGGNVMKLLNYLPLILIIIGLIVFVIAGYLFNQILGTIILGIALIITGILMIPIKLKGDDDHV